MLFGVGVEVGDALAVAVASGVVEEGVVEGSSVMVGVDVASSVEEGVGSPLSVAVDSLMACVGVLVTSGVSVEISS